MRFVVDRVEDSLRAVARTLGRPSNGRPERFAGKLRAALNYSQIDEIMADNPVRYLESIRKQCDQVHTALYQTYITYSIEAAIANVAPESVSTHRRRAHRFWIVMPYLVRHLTRFTYTSPVSESVMELRMQPLSDGRQRLLRFDVATTPRTRVFAYRDFLGNAVHYFDIPGRHTRLDISAEAAVEVMPLDDLPEALDTNAWQALDQLAATGAYGDWLAPSRFATGNARAAMPSPRPSA